MNKKLTKKQLMMLTDILKDINFRNYVNEILNTNNTLFSNVKNKESMLVAVIGDIVAYLIENLRLCENNIDKLLSSYLDIDIEKVEEMEAGDYFENIKIIFMSVPAIVQKVVNLDSFKKKMKTEMSKLNKD